MKLVLTHCGCGCPPPHVDASPGLFEAIDLLAAERTAASFESLAGLVIKHFSDEEALGLSESHLVRIVFLYNNLQLAFRG